MTGNIARRVLATFHRPTSPRGGATRRTTTPNTCPEILRRAVSLSGLTGADPSASRHFHHVICWGVASKGSLAVGFRPSSSVAQMVASTFAKTVGRTQSFTHRSLDRRKVTYHLQVARQRVFHSSSRQKSSPQSDEHGKSPNMAQGAEVLGNEKGMTASGKGAVACKATQRTTKGLAAASAVNKHVMDRLPSMPHIHRPNKEELLAAATGFWSRLKVRFKWFSIRSARPFNMDEIGAFFSWFVLGHVIWIIVGTTTFFSLAIFAVNTVFAQGNPSEYASPLTRG